MTEFESGWKDASGVSFYMRGWQPAGNPRGVVAVVHGHGEHSGRYAHVAEHFAKRRYATVGFDLRGHGKSSGARGHTPSYNALMDDLTAFLAQVSKRYPGVPMYLYGHSLGGNLVLNHMLRRKPPVRGVIATGPWLALAMKAPVVKVWLGRVMNGVLPGFSQPSGLDQSALSRDRGVVEAYARDPLVHNRISARMFVALSDAAEWAMIHAAESAVPLLMMQGLEDRIVSADAARDFAERSGRNTTWIPWKGMYHEIHNEPDGPKVVDAMVDWMKKQESGGAKGRSVPGKAAPRSIKPAAASARGRKKTKR